jgi:Holliday junction resolvase RusA-like endonuclease
MPYAIEMAVPPAVLGPNARPSHWSQRARAARRVRASAKALGLALGIATPMRAARVTPIFFFPARRRRDRDNLLARCKAIFDGLADAGVVRDDSDITYEPVRVEIVPRALARVRIEIVPDDR